ncbi:MAG: DUF4270 family protein [Niastella sp.]|nr:DUF4270 family protein [Niastella sp.]
MRKNVFPVIITGILVASFVFWGCTKLDTTNLGVDLIPAVDNVHTFRDTFQIETTQGFFNDTSQVNLSGNFLLGRINNDPLFGTTNAELFLQFKPPFYPYYYGNPLDTLIGIDSVVLTLKYSGSYGDTTIPQQLEVTRITDTEFSDSSFKPHNINYSPMLGLPVSSVQTVDIRNLPNKVYFAHGKDSSTNQIRIKLDPIYANEWYLYDSSATGSFNAFRNDSLFRKIIKGLAVKSISSGNALMYLVLDDPDTRLEIHFRKRFNGKVDTVFNSLGIQTAYYSDFYPSAVANHIQRDRTGTPSLNPGPDELYLQTSPGSYANLHFPGLHPDSISNRVINRAEIVVEQIPDNPYYDSVFAVPHALYVDLIDTAAAKWKPIYFDLNPMAYYDPDNASFYFPSSMDYNSFGAFPKHKTGPGGTGIYYYTLNVTRQLQDMVSRKHINYDMRLFAPYTLVYPQYSTAILPYANPLAFGRIKIGSGSNPQYRMKLIMTWTKI